MYVCLFTSYFRQAGYRKCTHFETAILSLHSSILPIAILHKYPAQLTNTIQMLHTYITNSHWHVEKYKPDLWFLSSFFLPFPPSANPHPTPSVRARPICHLNSVHILLGSQTLP